MRRLPARQSLLMAVVCATWIAACGGGGNNGELVIPNLEVTGVTAGYVPEALAIRVAWLPVSHPAVEAYQILRSDAFSLNDPISSGTVVPELTQIGETTATIFDDPEVDPARKYGYGVRILYIDNTTSPISLLAWAPIPQQFSPLPEIAFETTDACEAVSAAATIDAVSVRPAVEARPGVLADANARFAVSANLFDAGTLQSTWYRYTIDGGKTAISAPKNLLLPERCSSHTRAYTDNQPLLNPLTATTSDYAIGVEATFNNGSPPWRVLFPNDEASESIRMTNVEPAPGQFLAHGVHAFQSEIVYNLNSTAGLTLAAAIEVYNQAGVRSVLDATTIDLEAAAGTVAFASTITLPTDAIRARMVARVGRGDYDSIYVEDVVDYAVVP